MQVLDPGHRYAVHVYDDVLPQASQTVTFMKREGPGYPFNVGCYPGTNCQELLRVLIDRAKYLQTQIPCGETEGVLALLRQALWLFESRAARRHGRVFEHPLDGIEALPVCHRCGHIDCADSCARPETV